MENRFIRSSNKTIKYPEYTLEENMESIFGEIYKSSLKERKRQLV